jgi:hypothetical protein
LQQQAAVRVLSKMLLVLQLLGCVQHFKYLGCVLLY